MQDSIQNELKSIVERRGAVPLKLIWPLLAVVFLFIALYQPLVRAPIERALEERGVKATATIIERYRKRERRLIRRSVTKKRYNRFEFQTSDGQTIQFVEKVSSDFYDTNRVGGQFEVTYLPDDPNTYHMKSLGRRNAKSTLVLCMCLTGLFTLFTWLAWA